MIYGLVTRTIPFFRTPKLAMRGGMMQALAEAREELYILILLWGAMAGLLVVHEMDTTDAYAWAAMLILQSLAYLAAVVMSILAVLPPREPPKIKPAATSAHSASSFRPVNAVCTRAPASTPRMLM